MADIEAARPIEPGVPEKRPARRSFVSAVVRAMRPRQWTKNAAVAAPLVFAHKALEPALALKALAAVVCFCLLSSAVYLFNDIADRDKDRQHPLKRQRPIAAGELSVAAAALMATGLAAVSLAVFWALGLPAFFGALGYLGLQGAYTAVLKRLVLVDVLTIALGFVVRVASGALVIEVPISNWLYICTFLLALFLGFAKRRAELVLLEGNASAHRENLSELSLALVDQLIAVIAGATIVCYALYTMSEETIRKFGTDGLKYTIPCVIYGLFRYLYLSYRRNEGGSPERLLLSDVPLIVDLLLFGAIVGVVLYR